ncbi:MAG: hypothetical protein ACO1QB_01255 [Verrucomicrobiales bacterium]
MKKTKGTKKVAIACFTLSAIMLMVVVWDMRDGATKVKKLGGGPRLVTREKSPGEFYYSISIDLFCPLLLGAFGGWGIFSGKKNLQNP